jgi:predicted protein tyrosine phosphatase
MDTIDDRFVICGTVKIPYYQQQNITHILSVANPEIKTVRPKWFTGEFLELKFGDINSVSDAAKYKTIAPSIDDVARAVDFMSRAWSVSGSKVLIHCDYGISRSSALAYVAVTNELGVGSEEKALLTVLNIQPSAVPNLLVVQLGDEFLKRSGALLKPMYKHYKQIMKEFTLGWQGMDF